MDVVIGYHNGIVPSAIGATIADCEFEIRSNPLILGSNEPGHPSGEYVFRKVHLSADEKVLRNVIKTKITQTLCKVDIQH